MNKFIFKYTSTLNEWHDSFYSFNKNKLNFSLFYKNKSTYNLIYSYFNLRKQPKIPRQAKFVDFVYEDNIIKQLNKPNKIDHNIQTIFNQNLKANFNFLLKRKYRLEHWKWKKLYYIVWYNRKKKLNYSKTLKRFFVSQLKIKHSNNNINVLIFIYNRNRLLLNKKLKKLEKKLNNKTTNNKTTVSLVNNIFILKKNLNNLITYKNKYYLLKRNYLSNLYLNKFKYNKINLINIKNIINKIYNKNVLLNIINIKYIYLENTLLVESLTKRINDRKKKLLRTLKKLFKLINLAEINNFDDIKWIYEYKKVYDNVFNKSITEVYKNIIKYIRNKHLMGIYIRTQGRLTKRMTASRAVYKLKCKGNLINYTYLHNIPSVLLRGSNRDNIVNNGKNSHNKNGSYGIYSKINTF